MAIRKISRERISDQVFHQMRDQIAGGEWKAGDKIPSENELAEQFGVSRVTVRNALQKLSALGLIETRFGDGSYVSEPDAQAILRPIASAVLLNDRSFEEILQFRRMIEGPVCREACRLGGKEELKRLRSIYCDMQACGDDLQKFSKSDYRFHMEIVRMTGNSILIQMYQIAQEVIQSSFDRVVHARGIESGLYYHGRILDALEAGDEERAEAEMKAHVEDLYQSYRRKFK